MVDHSCRPHRIPRRYLQPGKELHDAIFGILHTPPTEHGLNRTTWKISDLKDVLMRQGHRSTRKNIMAVIQKAGYRWKKARLTLTSRDPDYRRKLDALRTVLSNLNEDEAFFSIDEFGPFAVKMRGGRSLCAPNEIKTVPQWQKSRGAVILTAVLELSKNQVTHFYSERKNSAETLKLVRLLRERYKAFRRMYVSWDAAPWHSSKVLSAEITLLNSSSEPGPEIVVVPLPAVAQFLNVIESVFSGMARAVIHNSNYANVAEAKTAISRYLEDRNLAFREAPSRAGQTIWGKERVPSRFVESNNCKDPKYR